MWQRINDPKSIDKDEVRRLASEGKKIIFQFSNPNHSNKVLQDLNEFSKEFEGIFDVRFYGHYSEVFDGNVLKHLLDIPSLLIDCITKAVNLDYLANMKNLKEFSLGVYEMDIPDILGIKSLQNLRSLCFGETKKSNIDLSHLVHFSKLEDFHTTGHAKNIESLIEVPNLKYLSLSQIKKKVNIDFVSELKILVNLRLILGGRESIENIENDGIRKLEIIRVRGLEELGDLGRFTNLEELQIEDQIKLKEVRFNKNKNLKELKVLNCKTLDQVSGLSDLSSLEHMRVYQTSLDYEKFISQPLPVSLKKLAFYTSKVKQDRVIEADLLSKGYLNKEDCF